MAVAWLVRVELPTIDSELVSSLLWSLHTTGIAEQAVDGVTVDTTDRAPRSRLLAGFGHHAEAVEAAAALRRSTPGGWSVEVTTVDEGAWVDREQTTRIEVAGTTLSLEVGGAFGHGAHPTTRLALDLLTREGQGPTAGASVLDFGCGTGVLTLAALALGARRVTAVDHDATARAVTGHNLGRNRELVAIGGVEIRSAPRLEDGAGHDVVVANVLLPVHREWGPRLGAPPLLTDGGVVIVSGVLGDQRSQLLDAYPGLAVIAERTDGDWIGLVLTRPRPTTGDHG
jgi:ribosomal protein L11 methylase PrmA